jgi:hypothetical protein
VGKGKGWGRGGRRGKGRWNIGIHTGNCASQPFLKVGGEGERGGREGGGGEREGGEEGEGEVVYYCGLVSSHPFIVRIDVLIGIVCKLIEHYYVVYCNFQRHIIKY